MRLQIRTLHLLRNTNPISTKHIHNPIYKVRSPHRPLLAFHTNTPTNNSNRNFMGSSFSTSSTATNSTDTMSSKTNTPPVQKSDDEWRAILSPEQFRILRTRGTEQPHSGTYNHHSASGTYTCVGCDAPLYTSTSKFDSGCGWPAFFEGVPGAINRREDGSLGMQRTEITCANCGGHLGHVFKGEGFGGAADERHCVNSVSLTFKEE
ncbi:SelR-domain-containing protein [Choiromyces venosus 120613-1]|uniref:Peptide-methionine (R)-S-oxide reductase n=1 Tax=Choiromyces venosus 120613-1 TaxID=1336337 RepID=A0A3N4JF24_9PEZI|nr:SelR-domain-containing protein [Choiromyces venosus 120613-1]